MKKKDGNERKKEKKKEKIHMKKAIKNLHII